MKSRAKIVNTAFALIYATPCKLVCKCDIYYFCLWFPPLLHWTWNTSGNEEKNAESLNEGEFIEHCTLKSDCLKWHIRPKNITEIIYRYLHSFPGDRPDYFQVLCNSLAYASIGCRKLFRLQCTLGLYMRGIGHRTHTERHGHCRSCRLQTVGNAH